jgi:hypothetical protein
MSKKATKNSQKDIESYQHKDKDRVNNPPVGLVIFESYQSENPYRLDGNK